MSETPKMIPLSDVEKILRNEYLRMKQPDRDPLSSHFKNQRAAEVRKIADLIEDQYDVTLQIRRIPANEKEQIVDTKPEDMEAKTPGRRGRRPNQHLQTNL